MGVAMTRQRANQDAHDVAVVGLGPVGELGALLLAREGMRVLALERQADTYSRPRVGVLDGEGLRTLQKAGVYDRAAADMILGVGAQWASRHGQILATTMPTETIQGHSWLSAIYQPLLDQTLREALDSHPGVEVRLGQELTTLTEAGDGVRLTFRQPDGSLGTAHARFVIGCDGANSAIRAAIGVEMVGPSYEEPWLIVDAKLPEPPAQLPYIRFTMDPDGPRMTARLAAGNQRWERLVMQGEDREDMLRPSVALQMIAEHADPDTAQILRQVIYTHAATQAEHWRVGRVMLCGDAAHLMPPNAGQGLNSGIRDVTNLTWKLAAVIRDGAPAELLDTYEIERRPHVEKMTTLAVSLGRLLMTRSHLGAALRDRALRALTRIPGIRHAVLQGRYRPPARYKRGLLVGSFPRRSSVGRLFPQPDVRTFDGELKRLDGITGTGWRILGWEADPSTALSPRGRHLAQDVLRSKLITLCGPGRRPIETGASRDVLEDMHGVARPFFGRPRFVVIRPDGYVYANPTRQELEETIGALAPQIASAAVGLPQSPLTPAKH
jgi:3-(3-hydroxy-phenyl)propionate hydroxylase